MITFSKRGFGYLPAGIVSVLLVGGCGAEGEGTVKVQDANAVREKFAGEGTGSAKLTPKEAAARAAVEEAGKKNPKLK